MQFYDTDQVLVKASVLVDLQQRVLKAEAEVKQKQEENESLQKDLDEYNKKWLENETNFRLMEEHWQKQMDSLQTNFSLLKKKMIFKGGSERNRFSWGSFTMNESKSNRRDTINGLTNEFAQRTESLLDNANSLMDMNSNQTDGSSTPQQDLKKLKITFDTWKKDFDSRLKETKVNVDKFGNDENGQDIRKKKKWWGRLRALRNDMSG